MKKEELTGREKLIRELATFSNFTHDIDSAVYSFALLCISNLYNIKNPFDIIENKKERPQTNIREPRACLYYILWLNTGRSYVALNELCPCSSDTVICKQISRIRTIMKRENCDQAINIKNIQARVEKFKNIIKSEWMLTAVAK